LQKTPDIKVNVYSPTNSAGEGEGGASPWGTPPLLRAGEWGIIIQWGLHELGIVKPPDLPAEGMEAPRLSGDLSLTSLVRQSEVLLLLLPVSGSVYTAR